jgi:hypothetical protein
VALAGGKFIGMLFSIPVIGGTVGLAGAVLIFFFLLHMAVLKSWYKWGEYKGCRTPAVYKGTADKGS